MTPRPPQTTPPAPSPPRAAMSQTLLVVIVLASVAVGGAVGLSLNPGRKSAPPPSRPSQASPGPSPDVAHAAPSPAAVVRPAAVRVPATALSVRWRDIQAPADPFQPTRAALKPPVPVQTAGAAPAALPGPQAAMAGQSVTPTGGTLRKNPAGSPALAAKAGARPASAKAELPAITVSGIVGGDSPVAVVQYGGQSFFLKIGDRLADTWRLVETRERSVIFRQGKQRVEIPIQGGSAP
jgi:hypothetical protein